jgi:hypothetical protein
LFSNPEIYSELIRVQMAAGYYGACDPCADMLESGQLHQLADSALTIYGPVPQARLTAPNRAP